MVLFGGQGKNSAVRAPLRSRWDHGIFISPGRQVRRFAIPFLMAKTPENRLYPALSRKNRDFFVLFLSLNKDFFKKNRKKV